MSSTSTLKSISEFIRTGKTPPTQEVKYFNGKVQWFTPGDLDKEKYLGISNRSLTELAFIDKKATYFPAGTLLVACIGDIGKLGITTQDCSANQQITGIKPNSTTDVNFLYYWFRHNKMVIQHFANNAVVPIINNGTLEKIKIPLPPLPEQQKIASLLDAADSLRQKDQQLIEKYTALSQSLFLEMFGDPVSNPLGWDTKGFLEIFDTKTGKLDSNASSEDGIYPFFTCSKEILKIDSYTYDCEALLLAGNNAAGIFDVKYYLGKFDAYQRTYILTLKSGELSYPFMQAALERKLKDLQRLSIGSSTQYLTMQILSRLIFIVPAGDLQNQFAERILAIEAQKQLALASLEKSEALFNSLLQRAFKGELTA